MSEDLVVMLRAIAEDLENGHVPQNEEDIDLLRKVALDAAAEIERLRDAASKQELRP